MLCYVIIGRRCLTSHVENIASAYRYNNNNNNNNHRESVFLFQRISVLIQRFNAVAVLGTFAPTTPEEDF